MKQFLKVLTASAAILSLSATPLINIPVGQYSSVGYAETIAALQLTGNDRFQFTKNSTSIYVNGAATTSDEKVTIVKGTTFVQLKTIAKLYGFKVSYNKETKETIAKSGSNTIAFKLGEATYTLNGKKINAGGKSYTINGNLMIPIRAWSNATGSSLQVNGQYISLQWKSAPSAAFSINERSIIAGETTVSTTDHASTPLGHSIINEKWEGLESIYATPGYYQVTRQVQDERGIWSPKYSVPITVLAPNVAPTADFSTNKSTYKIGEPVTYTNLSKDVDGSIVRNTWTGNDPAFFKAGTYTIKLEVQDDRKATHVVEKQITLTDEVMYTQNQFYFNFASTGDKIPIDSGFSLKLPSVPYEIVSEQITSVRTNSPEQLTAPAIDYTDVITGPVRFNIHKQNIADQSLELHLVATNESDQVVSVNKNREVQAGPATYVSTAGKTAASRYLQTLLEPINPTTVKLQPGESVELLTDIRAIGTGKTMTIFSEYSSDSPIRYTLVVTPKGGDAVASLDTLPQSEHDGKHIRGTFTEGNRDIVVDKVLGENGGDKLILGDKTQVYDKLLTGVDAITGNEIINYGNGGVVYRLSLQVAPKTAVLLNPRGGHYGGSFIINDKVVPLTSTSILTGQNEAGFIYRTGNTQETVTVQYIVAPGSNMPLHLMFVPVPSLTPETDNNSTDADASETTDSSTENTTEDQTVSQEEITE